MTRSIMGYALDGERTRIYANVDNGDGVGKCEIAAIIPAGCVIDESLLDSLVGCANDTAHFCAENEELRKRCEELEKRNPLGGETLEKLREIVSRFNAAYKNCNAKLSSAQGEMDNCYNAIDSARDYMCDADDSRYSAKGYCDKAGEHLSEMGGAIFDLDALVKSLDKEVQDGEVAVPDAD